MEIRCGIDLGGTKIEGVLIETNHKELKVIERLRLPTEKEKGYRHIINQVCKVVQLLEASSSIKVSRLGIGTPGTSDPITGLLKNSNTTCLNGLPFKHDLENKLGIPIEIANDANCFALAETRFGIVAEQFPEAKVVFGVIMGTGVGGGLVVNGQVVNGRHGIAGEWGHNFLDSSGGECYCGKEGCVERILAGPSLERYYLEQTGNSLKLKEIVQRHKAKTDPKATKTIERLLYFFGKAIASITNTIDPDVIILGGGVGNIDLLYTEELKSLKHYIFNPTVETKILKPKLGDSAGVFGAALLIDD